MAHSVNSYHWAHDALCGVAPQPVDEIIVEGSDTNESPSRKAERCRRREAIGRQYLRGYVPFIQSAQLLGPFGDSGDWLNPWRDNRHCKPLKTLSRGLSNKYSQSKVHTAESSAPPNGSLLNIDTTLGPMVRDYSTDETEHFDADDENDEDDESNDITYNIRSHDGSIMHRSVSRQSPINYVRIREPAFDKEVDDLRRRSNEENELNFEQGSLHQSRFTSQLASPNVAKRKAEPNDGWLKRAHESKRTRCEIPRHSTPTPARPVSRHDTCRKRVSVKYSTPAQSRMHSPNDHLNSINPQVLSQTCERDEYRKIDDQHTQDHKFMAMNSSGHPTPPSDYPRPACTPQGSLKYPKTARAPKLTKQISPGNGDIRNSSMVNISRSAASRGRRSSNTLASTQRRSMTFSDVESPGIANVVRDMQRKRREKKPLQTPMIGSDPVNKKATQFSLSRTSNIDGAENFMKPAATDEATHDQVTIVCRSGSEVTGKGAIWKDRYQQTGDQQIKLDVSNLDVKEKGGETLPDSLQDVLQSQLLSEFNDEYSECSRHPVAPRELKYDDMYETLAYANDNEASHIRPNMDCISELEKNYPDSKDQDAGNVAMNVIHLLQQVETRDEEVASSKRTALAIETIQDDESIKDKHHPGKFEKPNEVMTTAEVLLQQQQSPWTFDHLHHVFTPGSNDADYKEYNGIANSVDNMASTASKVLSELSKEVLSSASRQQQHLEQLHQGLLPSTRLLPDMATTNPWISLSKKLHGARPAKRVSWGPLPLDDKKFDEADLLPRAPQHLFSPPPPLRSPETTDPEDAFHQSQKVFDVRGRSWAHVMGLKDTQSIETPNHKIRSATLYSSPAVDAMAKAFIAADKEVLHKNGSFHDNKASTKTQGRNSILGSNVRHQEMSGKDLEPQDSLHDSFSITPSGEIHAVNTGIGSVNDDEELAAVIDDMGSFLEGWDVETEITKASRQGGR